MKATARAAALTAAVLAGVVGVTSPVQADPLNSRDPDYCGNSPDILLCNDQKSTYPSAAEMAYLNAIRPKFPPGSEARRLAAGRTVCLELPKYPTNLIVEQVAAYLQIAKPTAVEVIESAHTNICPAAKTLG